jgi:hypothetical protein
MKILSFPRDRLQAIVNFPTKEAIGAAAKTKASKSKSNKSKTKKKHGKAGKRKVKKSKSKALKALKIAAAEKAAKAAAENANPERASFLSLPGEIRNCIYDLAIDERRILIKREHTAKEKKEKRDAPKKLMKESIPFLDRAQLQQPKPIPLGLMFSCRQIYQEVTTLLYSSTTFAFQHSKALRRFLDIVPTLAKASIRSIEIYHTQYGHPHWTKDVRFKEHHDFRFYMLCEKAVNQFTYLRQLRVDLAVHDYPVKLHLNTDWAAPWLLFGGKGLVKTDVDLSVVTHDEKLVNACAKILEREMLSDEAKKAWYVEDDMKRAEEKLKRKMEKRALPKTKILKVVAPSA